jgi:membrane-associated protease RseP (regulator of RpoE activity)
VLMELARRYGAQKDRQGRRIVFIAFSAEEHGLDGSRFYCKEPLFPLNKTAAMINMDMVGRTKPVPIDSFGLFGKKDRLLVYGTGTGEGFEKLVDTVNKQVDFKVTKLAAGTGPSDHDSFYRKGVPVLFLYTGIHTEYHKPTDVPEKIDVPGMKKVADFVEKLGDDVLTRETKPKYVVVKEPHSDPTDPTPRGPIGPRLGFLPGNYGAESGGVLVDGVNAGSVAEKAGIQAGDYIVEVAGRPTPNMDAYMAAMRGQKLGTTIDVVVERKGKKLTLKAELK